MYISSPPGQGFLYKGVAVYDVLYCENALYNFEFFSTPEHRSVNLKINKMMNKDWSTKILHYMIPGVESLDLVIERGIISALSLLKDFSLVMNI